MYMPIVIMIIINPQKQKYKVLKTSFFGVDQ